MQELFINSLLLPTIIGSIIVLISSQANQIEAAKRSKLVTLKQCQLDECNLKPQHYALYAFVKEAIDTKFDLNGKEIYPFLKAVETLRRRFSFSNDDDSNLNVTTKLIKSLLANETLIEAEEIFKSEQGSQLVDLYRSSVNGRSQNLACSQLRVQALERASKLMERNQFSQVFSKIHRNFMRKSAKKCLKHSCNYVETSMNKLQSVLGSKYQEEETGKINNELISDDSSSLISTTTSSQLMVNDPPTDTKITQTASREFEAEELELCKFFKRTNETDCRISGNELSEISLMKGSKDRPITIDDDKSNNNNNNNSNKSANDNQRSMLVDLLNTYRINHNLTTTSANDTNNISEQFKLHETGYLIWKQCHPISSLLEYNLAAIKWYRNEGLIDNQKLITRSFWCPSLAYWLQLDRLCGELKFALDGFFHSGTFPYEVDAQ